MKKETLLFMGVSTDTKYALEYARKIGVKTIITDYNSQNKKEEKQLADECWGVDVRNLDELEKRCQEEKINGIYAGNHELCLDMTKELARRLGLPFYASDEGWFSARDKTRFKEHCISCGLDVPKRYVMTQNTGQEEFSKIEYPVIVKPTDSSASRGVSICQNKTEMLNGIKEAMKFSESGQVVVEEYITGEEMTAMYFLYNGDVQRLYLTKAYPTVQNNKRYYFGVCNFCNFECDDYDKKTYSSVKRLFAEMRCESGCVFLQSIKKNDRYYFFEMGYRLDGLGGFHVSHLIHEFDLVGAMVDLALGHKVMAWTGGISLPENHKSGLVYLLGAKKGTVAYVSGLNNVKAMDGVEVVLERVKPGEEQVYENSMYQAVYYITIVTDTLWEKVEKLRKINECLQMIDENGNDMLIRFTNYKELEDSYREAGILRTMENNA